MTPEFEKSLNERMKTATLKDLMPDFDRDMEWHGLSEKLQPKKKRVRIPMWSYAAAILAIVSISWFLTKQNTQEQAKPESITVSTPIISGNNAQRKNILATAPVKKEVKEMTAIKEIKKNQQSLVKSKKDPIIQTDTSILNKAIEIQQPVIVSSNTTISASEPTIPIAAIKKERQHAMNILDIENEDRKFLTNEEARGTTSNIILDRMQYLISNRDAIVANDQPSLLQTIFKK